MSIKILAGIDLPIDYGCGSIMLAEDLYLLNELGLDAYFIALNPENNNFVSNVDYLLPLTQNLKINNPKTYRALLNLYVKDIAKKVKPNIIHCHHLCFPMTSSLAAISGVKRIGFCHGTDVMEVKNSYNRKREIASNINKMDALIFPSYGIFENLCKYITPNRNKVHIIPWGIPDYFFNQTKTALPRHNRSPFSIIYAGRINSGKSLDTILNALCILPSNIVLTIVSQDNLNNIEENLLKSLGIRVKYLDWVNRKELPNLLIKHQLMILPSLEIEAFGLIIAESQALGLPVIVSKVSGLVETVPPSSDSIMFEPGDYNELASIILKLYNSTSFWELCSKRGKEYANNFRMELFLSRIKEITLKVLSE